MTTFRYKGQTAGGAKVSGVLRAYDEFEAADKLRESVAIITKLEAVPEKKESVLSRPVAFRVKEKELALLCSQFAIILASGLSVERCVSMVAAQTKNKYLRRMLDKVSEEVGAGYSLAQSFENNAPYLPKTFTETLRAGEQSGTLESCFQRLQCLLRPFRQDQGQDRQHPDVPCDGHHRGHRRLCHHHRRGGPRVHGRLHGPGLRQPSRRHQSPDGRQCLLHQVVVADGRILSMDAMADFLRQAARDNGIPLTNAAVVLPSTEVFTRELTMPAMTEEDTRVTATLRVDEQAFTLSVPYGTAPTAEDVARLLTDNGISPDTIDSWTPDITQPLYADTAFTAVRKTADSGKSFTDTITLSVDGLDDVSAVFTMAPNYDITIVLHLADGGDSDCRLVLMLRENKADPAVSTVSGGGLRVRDVTTTTTTISWSPDNATIEKEAVVSKS